MFLPSTMCCSQRPVACGRVGQLRPECVAITKGAQIKAALQGQHSPLLRMITRGRPALCTPRDPHCLYLELETVKRIKDVREIPHCVWKSISLLRWAVPKHTFSNCLNDANVPTFNNLEIFVLESHSGSTETFLKSLIISHFQQTFGNLWRGQIVF